MADFDAADTLLDQVNQARANGTPLRIQGGNSKAFLGREVAVKCSTPVFIAASSVMSRPN
jgi:hypothetical protein